jgi:hypothetical protein
LHPEAEYSNQAPKETPADTYTAPEPAPSMDLVEPEASTGYNPTPETITPGCSHQAHSTSTSNILAHQPATSNAEETQLGTPEAPPPKLDLPSTTSISTIGHTAAPNNMGTTQTLNEVTPKATNGKQGHKYHHAALLKVKPKPPRPRARPKPPYKPSKQAKSYQVPYQTLVVPKPDPGGHFSNSKAGEHGNQAASHQSKHGYKEATPIFQLPHYPPEQSATVPLLRVPPAPDSPLRVEPNRETNSTTDDFPQDREEPPIYSHICNLAHKIAPEWKGVLIQQPGLVQSRIPASAIQSHIVHAGQQSGYIPFEPCYLAMQPAWQTANL